MTSLGTLIRLEFTKAIRRPMTWVLGVIFVGFMGFMYTALTAALLVADAEVEGMEEFDAAFLEDILLLPEAMYFGSELVISIGAIVMIVFAAGSFGSEFGWATIRMMVLMRVDRTRLVVGKLIMIAILSALVTIIGMAVVFAGAVAAELIAGDSGNVGDQLTSELFGDALVITLRSIIAIGMWALIGGILALAFSSLAIGTGVALAGYFVGDLIITLIGQLGTLGEWFARLMPTYGINGLILLNQTSPPDFSTAEMIGMVVSIIAWATIFIVLGLYRFRKMDLIAASS